MYSDRKFSVNNKIRLVILCYNTEGVAAIASRITVLDMNIVRLSGLQITSSIPNI